MSVHCTYATGNSSRLPKELNYVFPVTTTYFVLSELKRSCKLLKLRDRIYSYSAS